MKQDFFLLPCCSVTSEQSLYSSVSHNTVVNMCMYDKYVSVWHRSVLHLQIPTTVII